MSQGGNTNDCNSEYGTGQTTAQPSAYGTDCYEYGDCTSVSECMSQGGNTNDCNSEYGTGQTTSDQQSISGCMDPEANNYNSQAMIDDGSCTYSDD
jgi:hypothetical protein